MNKKILIGGATFGVAVTAISIPYVKQWRDKKKLKGEIVYTINQIVEMLGESYPLGGEQCEENYNEKFAILFSDLSFAISRKEDITDSDVRVIKELINNFLLIINSGATFDNDNFNKYSVAVKNIVDMFNEAV